MKNVFLSAIIGLIVLSACKKDKDECKTDMASISGTYKLTAEKYKPASGPEVDYYATVLPDCKKDDLQILKSNAVYTYQDLGTVCGIDGSFETGWSLSGNTINLNGKACTITSWDCHTLVVTFDNAGDLYTMTLTRQ